MNHINARGFALRAPSAPQRAPGAGRGRPRSAAGDDSRRAVPRARVRVGLRRLRAALPAAVPPPPFIGCGALPWTEAPRGAGGRRGAFARRRMRGVLRSLLALTLCIHLTTALLRSAARSPLRRAPLTAHSPCCPLTGRPRRRLPLGAGARQLRVTFNEPSDVEQVAPAPTPPPPFRPTASLPIPSPPRRMRMPRPPRPSIPPRSASPARPPPRGWRGLRPGRGVIGSLACHRSFRVVVYFSLRRLQLEEAPARGLASARRGVGAAALPSWSRAAHWGGSRGGGGAIGAAAFVQSARPSQSDRKARRSRGSGAGGGLRGTPPRPALRGLCRRRLSPPGERARRSAGSPARREAGSRG